MCAEYGAQTGRLRILKDGAPLRECFPPKSRIDMRRSLARATGERDQIRMSFAHYW
jgi:hypothetical protein